MGTNNLICVVKDNEFKIAQYSQYNGQLFSNGEAVLKFIRSEMNFDTFSNNLDSVHFVDSDKEWDEIYHSVDIFKGESEMLNDSECYRFNQAFPQFHRSLGVGVLNFVQNSNSKSKSNDKILLQKRIAFAENQYCEYVYLLNLDSRELEVYSHYCDKKNERSDLVEQYRFHPDLNLFSKIPFSELKADTMKKLEEREDEYAERGDETDSEEFKLEREA